MLNSPLATSELIYPFTQIIMGKDQSFIKQCLTMLRARDVRMIQHPADLPHEILIRTVQEQEREVRILLKNECVSQSLKFGLETALDELKKGQQIVSWIVNLDEQLDYINMALVKSKINGAPPAKTEFNFNNSGLTRLPNKLIDKLIPHQVTKLVIEGNYLSSLPENIGNLSSLRSLRAAHNQLIFLPDSIGKLSNIIQLDFNYNQLTYLPEAIGMLWQLDFLYISYNQLTHLPTTMGNLRLLSRLDASHNQLAFLPNAMGRLKSLSHFYINDNLLLSLPSTIGQLLSLICLCVKANKLTELPNIEKLNSLFHLDVSENQLSFLPDVANLTQLAYFFINHNKLSTLPDGISKLGSLVGFNIRGNPFKTLPLSLRPLLEKTQKPKYLPEYLPLLTAPAVSLLALLVDIQQAMENPYRSNHYSKNTQAILEIVKLLDQEKVRLILQSHAHDRPYKILHNTIVEQTREIIALLQNPIVSEGVKAELKALHSDTREQGYLVSAIIKQDAFINSLNMALADLKMPLNDTAEINLNDLGLTRIPNALIEKLRTYPKLAKLNLRGNQLNTLANALCHLWWIIDLDLSNNQLTHLPDTIGSISMLQRLNLNDNKLSTFPNTFVLLEHLTELYLANNQFSTLPSSFGEFKNLHNLNLGRNPLKNLPAPLLTILKQTSNDHYAYLVKTAQSTSLTVSFSGMRVSPKTTSNETKLPVIIHRTYTKTQKQKT